MTFPTYKLNTGFKIIVATLLVILILLAISATATAKGKPAGKGGGGNDTANVEITASGVVLATQKCQDALSASSSDILCNKGGHQIMLGDFFVGRSYTQAIAAGAPLLQAKTIAVRTRLPQPSSQAHKKSPALAGLL